MSIALAVMMDGRYDYHTRALRSAMENLPKFDQYIFVDDYNHELGFAGAVQHAWSQVETDYLFHFEADFTFNEPPPIGVMRNLLKHHPHLVQFALMRQPINPVEKARGWIVPDDHRVVEWNPYTWVEHTGYVTTNPSLWPRWVIDRGWPQRSESEGHFGIDLFASNEKLRAAFWGTKELVTHIGDERRGKGY